MSEGKPPPGESTDHRRKAEERIRAGEAGTEDEAEPDVAWRMRHELLVHQIELEMQNEELRRTQHELEAARERHFGLYDLAPVAYFTLDEQDAILESNLKAAGLMDVARGVLAGQHLSRFILPEDQDIYYRHRKRLFETGEPQMCELRIKRSLGEPIWVSLDSNVAKDVDGAPVCRAFLSDITERKQAEAALQESEDRFKYVFEDSILGKSLTLPTGKVQVNQAFADMLGYSLAEMTSKSWQKITHPDDLANTQREVDSLLSGEHKSARFTKRYVRKDGSVMWAEVATSVRRDTTGAPMFFITSVIDITERKRAEDALRENRERLRALTEASPDYLMLLDREMRVRYVNRIEPGLTLDDVQDRPLYELASEADRDAVRQKLEEALSSLLPVRYETCHERPDGTSVVFESYVAVARTGDDLLGLAVASRDITERKRAEDALRASDERYRRLFEEDLTGDYVSAPDGTVLACNRSFARILGFASLEEAMGTNVNELYAKPAKGKELLDMLTTRGNVECYEVELVRRDGTRVNVIANAVGIFGDAGELEQIQAYLFDVSEIRLLEAQLRQSQKMEAVGSLAGGVAHDFNNLLQAMMSQVQVMRSRLSDPTTLARDLTELDESIRRGAQLTSQLLLFSRRETKVAGVIDLNHVVQRGADMLRRLVRANIQIAVVPGDVALPIEGDRGQLEQVLANLTVNASDAMPGGGRLAVRTEATPEGTARLIVSDTGSGIPADIRGRIFDPFFTTKGAGHGTGLGLSVVHGIVSRHSGRIEVESEEGRGTTFVITLPLTTRLPDESCEGLAVPGADLIPSKCGERILVVEDEEGTREGLRDILGLLGYHVFVVGSGEEARALPEDEPFDLLLTDLMLPGIAGSELARDLGERWPALKVILMSGYTEDEAVRRGVHEGSIRYLQKPFDMQRLAREVRAALYE